MFCRVTTVCHSDVFMNMSTNPTCMSMTVHCTLNATCISIPRVVKWLCLVCRVYSVAVVSINGNLHIKHTQQQSVYNWITLQEIFPAHHIKNILGWKGQNISASD